jgi:hypothetical protein
VTGACGREPCARHGWDCAWHGDEPDRCRRCHASWSVILRDGYHSCEQAWTWSDGKRADNAERVRAGIEWARAQRQEAAERPYEARPSTFCPHTHS